MQLRAMAVDLSSDVHAAANEDLPGDQVFYLKYSPGGGFSLYSRFNALRRSIAFGLQGGWMLKCYHKKLSMDTSDEALCRMCSAGAACTQRPCPIQP